MTREPILYRWWDADGRLLYVGKSVSVYARIAQHRQSSPFFRHAATMTMTRFATAEELSRAEVAAIRAERPLYNVMHSAGGGDHARTITVIDGPPPTLDTTVGHWVPIDPSDLGYGDLIQCVGPAGDIVIQGIIDDDWDPADEDEDEALGPGWYVLTDDGGEEVVITSIAHDFYEVSKWVCADPSDAFRKGVLDAYYGRVAARLDAWKAVA